MRKIGLPILLLVLTVNVYAQDATVKDLKNAALADAKSDTSRTKDKTGWKKGGIISFNLTQVSNSNWIAASGDKFSLSLSGALNAFAIKEWKKFSWNNSLDVNYGLVKTSTLGMRKINDRIDLISKFGYKPDHWKNVRISLLGQLRTQLTNGYDYDYFKSGTKRKTSGIFSPAYVTLAPGIEWTPKPWISIFASPASARWIIVNDPFAYADPSGIFNGNKETPLGVIYGLDSAKKVKTEFGAFVTISVKKEIFKNVNYTGKLDLYSNYLKNPQNVDIFWTNLFLMKVNKWLSVSYEIDFLYDDDIKQSKTVANPQPKSVGLQVLSTLGVGFTAKF